MSELNLGLRISSIRINININCKEISEAERMDNSRRSEARLKAADTSKEAHIKKYHLLNGY